MHDDQSILVWFRDLYWLQTFVNVSIMSLAHSNVLFLDFIYPPSGKQWFC